MEKNLQIIKSIHKLEFILKKFGLFIHLRKKKIDAQYYKEYDISLKLNCPVILFNLGHTMIIMTNKFHYSNAITITLLVIRDF
jgi:hypothetical protein